MVNVTRCIEQPPGRCRVQGKVYWDCRALLPDYLCDSSYRPLHLQNWQWCWTRARTDPHLLVLCIAERRLAQPDHAFVLTEPDEKLCKQAFLIAARVLAGARLLRTSCVCARVCLCVCVGGGGGIRVAVCFSCDVSMPQCPFLYESLDPLCSNLPRKDVRDSLRRHAKGLADEEGWLG